MRVKAASASGEGGFGFAPEALAKPGDALVSLRRVDRRCVEPTSRARFKHALATAASHFADKSSGARPDGGAALPSPTCLALP